MYTCNGGNDNAWRGPGLNLSSSPSARGNLASYALFPNSELPGGDVLGTGIRVDSLEECATMCTRQRVATERQQAQGHIGGADAYMAGVDAGALVPNWSGVNTHNIYPNQRCNAWVYDGETKMCSLKSKRMANLQDQDPQAGHGLAKATDLHYKHHPNAYPRTYAGYLRQDLVNQPSSVYTNACLEGDCVPPPQPSEFQLFKEPAWSQETRVNHTEQSRQGGDYDVRQGAILPIHSYCFAESDRATRTCGTTFPLASKNQCALMCSQRPNCNAWTFRPNYEVSGSCANPAPGLCTLGRVNEPAYHTTSPQDMAAVSGFSIGHLSKEIKRFLFGF